MTLGLAFFLLILIGFWEFYPYKTFEYIGEKSLILNPNKTVQAGGVLRVQTDLDHYTDGLIAIVSPQLIDGSIINYPSFTYITRKGHQTFERSFEIPKYLPSGIYHIEVQTSIKVNPIKSINIVRLSENFIITNCNSYCL